MPTEVQPWLACRIMATALVAIMLSPAKGMAHAILVQSEPPSGVSLPAGRVTLSFTYNSRIDRARSRLTLMRPGHAQSVLRIDPSGLPNVISSSTEITTPGPCVVRWQVLAVDGHITRGDVPFTVTGR